MKFPLFSPPIRIGEIGGNFKIGIIFDWMESFLYCLCSRGAFYSTVHWKWVTHESAKECWNGIAAKIFLFWKVFLMQADSELGNLRAKHSTLLQKCFCKMRPLSSRRLTMKNSKKASEWIFIQNISCGFVQKVSCHIPLK